jgi:hypothetical protein
MFNIRTFVAFSLLVCSNSFQLHFPTYKIKHETFSIKRYARASSVASMPSRAHRIPEPLKTQMNLAIRNNPNEQFSALTALQLKTASLLGIRTGILNYESWVWSHQSRFNESAILKLTAEIEESGGSERASPVLITCRSALLEMLLRFDYSAYLRACTALGGLVPRRELPNVQDVPLPASMRTDRKVPQQVDARLLGRTGDADGPQPELIPDCALPNVTFSESPLDQALLWIFRSLVQKETGFASSKAGISGLLEEGREFMLRQDQVPSQHPAQYIFPYTLHFSIIPRATLQEARCC